MSLQVEFLVGREIEVGKTYKGIVSSIKEYGAFVDFNGGQQGLLALAQVTSQVGTPTLHELSGQFSIELSVFNRGKGPVRALPGLHPPSGHRVHKARLV